MRILIADRQPQVRFALITLLNQVPGVEIVGESANTEETLAQLVITEPDLVLLHWRLNGTAACDLLPKLRMVCPRLKVLALSARPEMRADALAAGADAFVCKMDQPERLLQTIQSMSSNDPLAVRGKASNGATAGMDPAVAVIPPCGSVGAYIAAVAESA